MLTRCVLSRLVNSSLKFSGGVVLQHLSLGLEQPLVSQNVRCYARNIPVPKELDVAPDSPMRHHYLKSVHPLQVSHRIKKRTYLQHVWELSQLYNNKLNTVSSSVMIRQLEVLREKKASDYDQELANRIYEVCVARLAKTINYSDFEQAVSLFHALAIVGPKIVPNSELLLESHINTDKSSDTLYLLSDKLIYSYLARSVRNRDLVLSSTPRAIASILLAISRVLPDPNLYMNETAQDAIDKLSRLVVRRMRHLPPSHLSHLAEATSRLGPVPNASDSSDTWDISLAGGLSTLIGQDASRIAAIARARTLKVMEGVTREVLLRVGDPLFEPFSVPEMINVTHAYMRAGIQNTDVAQLLSETIAGRVQEVSEGNLERLVQSVEGFEGFRTPSLSVGILRRAEELGQSEEVQKAIAKRIHP
uniref:Uncharacterized protein n=1 Tax=Polytomella parva TaxID=51329 RepID=A0A7S0VSX0_9CHLO|mmetsp:Transcript_7945/g.15459  ORF Transcript_7945/g.15459 Transcript_7945/m.15459 type:complete len:419 (+) Transcript_7945:43-1299(+)